MNIEVRILNKKLSLLLASALIAQQVIVAPVMAADFGTLKSEKTQTVSPNVIHKARQYESGSVKRAVNVLDIDLSYPYTKIEMGLANPINKLMRTSTLAKQNSYEGHRVVGAINAAYFNGNGYPSTLIALNNEILNFGMMGTDKESPTQNPVAFGIGKDGKAIADYYKLDFTYEINGKTFSFDRIDSERSANKTVVYTSRNKTTGANEWGREIIVENASQSTKSLRFGDVITGTVKAVTRQNVDKNSEIPENGFVISANGTGVKDEFNSIQPGDQVTLRVGIDEKWQDAQFIMAAGPLLVNKGKVEVSMPSDASFAKDRHPRTAVGVDATGTKVFFVTVDGRLSGYSLGANLPDLGQYMISLGATQAINLDGGGSTTMVVRELGTNNPVMVNKPSDGNERGVSAILQVVNTAPQGNVQAVLLNATSASTMVGESYSMKVKSAYDEYFNPVTVNASELTWTVEGDIGYMEGTNFIATKKGSGKIIGTYNNGAGRVVMNMSVLDFSDKPYALNSFDNVSEWKSEFVKSTGSIAVNKTFAREGSGALQLKYNFKNSDTGTKAAYVDAVKPIDILGKPEHIGVWVFGDGNKNWLRGVVTDGSGAKHTIDFTAQSGLNWSGWKYVKATLPVGTQGPYKFERIYIASPVASEWANGTIYLDKLQAVYSSSLVEPIYTDVASSHWALPAIETLNTRGIIKGYENGTFKPEANITRAEAATLLSRMINQPVTSEIAFPDVPKTHYAYAAIQEAAAAGIIKGRDNGKFDPDGKLTRAEMAAMMVRKDKLTGEGTVTFKDVKANHWAANDIRLLAINNLVNGYEDGTFKPDANIKRAEFAQIINKSLNR